MLPSFGVTIIINENCVPTFMIQGEIYDTTGNLLPFTINLKLNKTVITIYVIQNIKIIMDI